MKVYTRGGDGGKTTAADGSRRSKFDVRVQAYGTVDEAGAFLGLAIAHMDDERLVDLGDFLTGVQIKLFDVGADLARGNRERKEPYVCRTELTDVTELEQRIDEYKQQTPPVKRFVLRGGTKPAAFLHTACVVVRRAERQTALLQDSEEIHRPAYLYLNRLSDLLFVLARLVNARLGYEDRQYERGGDVFR